MNREYRFLSQNDVYSGEVRAFVLRGHTQKRRKLKDERKWSRARIKHNLTAKTPDYNTTKSPRQQTTQGFDDPRTSWPVTDLLLGVNRTDPFQSMALTTTRNEKRCIDHYVNGSFLELGRVRTDSFFPPRDLHIRQILMDEVGLSTCVFFGASSLAHYNPNDKTLQRLASHYQVKALHKLRIRIQQESSQPRDATIHSVVGLLASVSQIRPRTANEDDWANTSAHLHGLRSLLARRGGWNPLIYSISLQWDLYWHDILFNGAISAQHTSFSAHLCRKRLCQSNLNALQSLGDYWTVNCVVEFTNAYRNFYYANMARLKSVETSPSLSPTQLFAPGTAAYRLLKDHTGFSSRPIVPILYLNIMWWNQQHCKDEYLAAQYSLLRSNLRRCDVDVGSSVECLMWAISQDLSSGRWLEPEWMHLTSRMLSVECKLTGSTQSSLRACMLDFITTTNRQDSTLWWRPDYVENLVIWELTKVAQKNKIKGDWNDEEL